MSSLKTLAPERPEHEPQKRLDMDVTGDVSQVEMCPYSCSASSGADSQSIVAVLSSELLSQHAAVGRRVAVPFRIDAVEAFCPGDISSVTAGRVTVKFSDGTWQVARERLFAIAE